MVDTVLTVLGTLITSAGLVAVAWFTYRSTRKRDSVTERLTERRDTIADRDSMIAGLRSDVTELRTEMNAQKDEVSKLRTEVGLVRDHNNALITYCYKLIAVIRGNGLADEIPTPPPNGIHI
ncbi:hypothetical protein [Arthrobacter sp. SX1312]|uniref:hypothetical protein n=1 Tax=Arthrobacter sp. SX1312 TaxID=2058896 RepID=UPI000CE5674C|nr:hypothetical protein [Arthrobacter sp. SX1312]